MLPAPNVETQDSRKGRVLLQKARAHILRHWPYFYRVVLGFVPKDAPNLGTLGVTSKMTLYVDFSWFGQFDVNLAAGCLIHEVGHVLRDQTRIDVFPDSKRANIAFDIPINDDLRKAGIPLPPWAVYSDTYGFPTGLSGEGYYKLLEGVKLPENSAICCGSCGSCGGGSDPTDANGKSMDAEDADGTGGGRSDADVGYFKKVGIQDLKAHFSGKNAGSAPGIWKEILTFEQETPVVPWQRILRSESSRAFEKITRGHSDYSLSHPTKRSYALRWIRPGLITSLPVVVIIEDVSASMGHPQLKENRVELIKALQSLGLSEVWYLSADAKVQTTPRRIRVADLLKLPVIGRGGTQFGPPIRAAMALRPKPELVFYSTDGGGFDNIEDLKPRNTQFIWLLAPSTWTRRPCSWGKQILTSNDKDARKKFELLK